MATAQSLTLTRSFAQGSDQWTNYPNFIGHYQNPNSTNDIRKMSARSSAITLTNCSSLSFTLNYSILPEANAQLPIVIQLDTYTTMPIYVLYSQYNYLNSNSVITTDANALKRLYRATSATQTAGATSSLYNSGEYINFSSYWNAGVDTDSNCSYDGTNKNYTITPGTNSTNILTVGTKIAFFPLANSKNGKTTYSGEITGKSCTITLNFASPLTGTYYLKFITPKIWIYNNYSGGITGNSYGGSAIQLDTGTTLSVTPTNADVTLTYTRGSLPTNAKKNGTGANFSVPSAVTIEAGTSTALATARSGTYWVNGGTQTTYTLTPQAKTGLTYTPATGQSVKTVITKYTQPSTSAWQIGSTKYNGGASYTPTTSTSVVAQFTTTTTTSYANTLPTISGSTATTNVNGYKVTFKGNGGTPTSSTSTATNTVSTAYSASGTWSTSTNGTAINTTTAFSTASPIYPLGYTAVTNTAYGSVTLPTSSTYKRTNYTLLGWSTNSAATTVPTSMHPGKSYTPSANVTLYAIWQANTSYTITFDDNLPTWFPYTINGIPSNVTSAGASIKISSTKPTTSFQTFLAWYLNSAGTGTSYAPGATVTLSSSGTTTLYAKWQAAITVNDNGTLRPIYGIYTNNNGTITTTTAITVNDNGTLRNFN